jgi:hypothetical protein
VIAEEAAMHSEELTEFGVAPPHPELKRLEPLLENWKAELEGGYFLVQEYETPSATNRPRETSTTGSTTPKPTGSGSSSSATTVRSRRRANRYEGRVGDGRLTFVGPACFQYQLDDDGDIKVAPDGTITVSWLLRDEAGEWQPWTTNTFRAGDDGAR